MGWLKPCLHPKFHESPHLATQDSPAVKAEQDLARASRNRPLLGMGLAVFAMFLFAAQDAVTKTLIQELPIAVVVFVRYIAFTIFAMLIAHFTGGNKRGLVRAFKSDVTVLQMARGFLLVTEIFVFSIGVRHLDLSLQHALFSSFPLVITALSMPFLGERVGPWRWGAVIVGFLGTLLIIRPGFATVSPWVIWPLLAACLYAVYNIITRIAGQSRDSFQTSLLYIGLFGLIGITPFGLMQWQTPQGDQIWLFALLTASSLAGHSALILSLMFTQASALQPLNYLLLVFASGIGVFVLGEPLPAIWTFIGGSVVVASGLFIIARERIRGRKSKSTE